MKGCPSVSTSDLADEWIDASGAEVESGEIHCVRLPGLSRPMARGWLSNGGQFRRTPDSLRQDTLEGDGHDGFEMSAWKRPIEGVDASVCRNLWNRTDEDVIGHFSSAL